MKQYSDLKIFHHQKALEAIENGDRFAPIYIRLKPTNLCNHHCNYCGYGSGMTNNKLQNRDNINHNDMIPWEKMQEIINDMGEMGVKAVTFSGGGEPLVYPYIIQTVEMIKERGIDFALITNGQSLSGDVAKQFYDAQWVRVSFDSIDEQVYMNLRNVSSTAHKTVCENLINFAKNKRKDCVFGINVVVGQENYTQIYEMSKWLKEIGVDNVKFSALIHSTQKGYHLPIKDAVAELIARAQSDFSDNNFQIINKYSDEWQDKNFIKQSFNKCYACLFMTIIAADCKVYTCFMRTYESGGIVGDLSHQSFKDMWFSEETTRRLANINPENDCHNFCVYENRNTIIQSYLDIDEKHINFI